MRKIVFFILLCLFLVPIEVDGSNELMCNGNSFELVKESSRVTIIKRGINPFIKEFGLDGHSVRPTKLYCTDETYYFYGYATGAQNGTYYDGYILVIDEHGEVIHEEVTNYQLEEEIIGLAVINDILITITNLDKEVLINGDRHLLFDHILIQTYDNNYQFQENQRYNEPIKKYEYNEQLLLLYFHDYETVDIGLDQTLNQFNGSEVLIVDEEYHDETTIPFINQAFLNGTPYTNGIHLTYPGNYQLSYNGQVFPFILHPLISGVTDGMSYDTAVRIVVSSGNVTVDGEKFISGDEVVTPGKHTLIVIGTNGYKQVVNFTITSKVEGVIHGHGYTKPLNITFQGEAYLNNNLVTSPLLVEEEGDYLLRIKGENGYVENYEFSLHTPENSITIRDIVSNLDIFLLGIVIITGLIVWKRK